MSTLEMFIQKGEQREIEKWEHKKAEEACINMLSRGFDHPTIAQLLGVELDFVERVAEQIDSAG